MNRKARVYLERWFSQKEKRIHNYRRDKWKICYNEGIAAAKKLLSDPVYSHDFAGYDLPTAVSVIQWMRVNYTTKSWMYPLSDIDQKSWGHYITSTHAAYRIMQKADIQHGNPLMSDWEYYSLQNKLTYKLTHNPFPNYMGQRQEGYKTAILTAKSMLSSFYHKSNDDHYLTALVVVQWLGEYYDSVECFFEFKDIGRTISAEKVAKIILAES